ncbi:hypothetical protein N9O57_01220 [bacterium]|nr:hypothetical protein [bacterium]
MKRLILEPYIALFVIIFLGSLLGKIKVKGVSFGSAAIIMIALVFGYFGVVLPKEIETVGLILFIFSVGIQAGPGFFESFKTGEVKEFLSVVIVTITLSSLLCIASGQLLDLSAIKSAGLFSGVMTSTATLAALTQLTSSIEPIMPYSIAYATGIFVTIIYIRILIKYLKIDVKKEIKDYQGQIEKHHPKILAKHFIIKNPNVDGQSIEQLNIRATYNCRVTRIKKPLESEGLQIEKGMILNLEDHVKAIGTKKDLTGLAVLLGPTTDKEIPLSDTVEILWILVTQAKVVGKKLFSLNTEQVWKAKISRIRRAGIDIIPNSNTRLRYGDKVLASVNKSTKNNFVKLLGDKHERTIDFIPISLSILLGVLFAQIKITVSGNSFGFGLAGGILIVTLFLSWLDKTGPLLWSMAGETNQFIRQLGTVFFLSGVGTRTGVFLDKGYSLIGLKIFCAALIVNLIILFAVTIFGIKIKKMNKLKFLGAMAGSLTCSPALTSITEEIDSSIPSTAYSICFPFALLLTIVIAQVIVFV